MLSRSVDNLCNGFVLFTALPREYDIGRKSRTVLCYGVNLGGNVNSYHDTLAEIRTLTLTVLGHVRLHSSRRPEMWLMVTRRRQDEWGVI